jgi:hypothetical protein
MATSSIVTRMTAGLAGNPNASVALSRTNEALGIYRMATSVLATHWMQESDRRVGRQTLRPSYYGPFGSNRAERRRAAGIDKRGK